MERVCQIHILNLFVVRYLFLAFPSKLQICFLVLDIHWISIDVFFLNCNMVSMHTCGVRDASSYSNKEIH